MQFINLKTKHVFARAKQLPAVLVCAVKTLENSKH